MKEQNLFAVSPYLTSFSVTRDGITFWYPRPVWAGISDGGEILWLSDASHLPEQGNRSGSLMPALRQVITEGSGEVPGATIFKESTPLLHHVSRLVRSGKPPEAVRRELPPLFPQVEVLRRILLGWVFLQAVSRGIDVEWNRTGLTTGDLDWTPTIPNIPTIVTGDPAYETGDESGQAFRVYPDPFFPAIWIYRKSLPAPISPSGMKMEKDGVLVEIGRGIWARLGLEEGGLVSLIDENGREHAVWSKTEWQDIEMIPSGGLVVDLVLMAVVYGSSPLAIVEASDGQFLVPADEQAARIVRKTKIDMDWLTGFFFSKSAPEAMNLSGRAMHPLPAIPSLIVLKFTADIQKRPWERNRSSRMKILQEMVRRICLAKLGNALRAEGAEAIPVERGLRVQRLPAKGTLFWREVFLDESKVGQCVYNPWRLAVEIRSIPDELPHPWAEEVGGWIAARVSKSEAIVALPAHVAGTYYAKGNPGDPGGRMDR